MSTPPPIEGYDLIAQSDDWLIWYVRELSHAADQALHGGNLTRHWAITSRIADVEDQLAKRGVARAQRSTSRHTERELELAIGLTTACAGWRELVDHVEKMTGQHLSTTRSAIEAFLALAQGREQPAVPCTKGMPS